MTLANKLTLTRLALAVVAFLCLWSQSHPLYAAAFVLYLAAVITDAVDGYVARVNDEVSAFGALVDPLADKILVLGALIAFIPMPEVEVPNWAVFAIVARELMVGTLRALAAASGKILSANRWGKWTMILQSVAILVILGTTVIDLYAPWPMPRWMDRLSYPLVSLCALVSLASGVQYLYEGRALLRRSWNPSRGR
ncbi:MAG TPA: CDP-diacylglycerol--glycerol-3-phosphate 3-phosphatidyltransferase [Elusimicrobiota bacterium]|nr:CDP-diacylglycerol--glycerol-3-phosphate 3-phosphatidyltransferase [Elusimicrobiota bacterium]